MASFVQIAAPWTKFILLKNFENPKNCVQNVCACFSKPQKFS